MLGIIPWAPIPAGKEAMERYMRKVRERAGEAAGKVVGVRYLVQSEPPGTMLRDRFIEGLRWLGREGLSFDLGVDYRSGGPWQLKEAVEMIRRVNEEVEEKERVVFVISELLKSHLNPNFLREHLLIVKM